MEARAPEQTYHLAILDEAASMSKHQGFQDSAGK
jgi:hypothetical protein